MTDDGVRLLVGGAWKEFAWGDIRNPVITRQEYLPTRRRPSVLRLFTPDEASLLAVERRKRPQGAASKAGIVESDLLSFDAGDGTHHIDVSVLTPHFDHDLELRNIIFERMHPRIGKQAIGKRLNKLFAIVIATAAIAAFITSAFVP